MIAKYTLDDDRCLVSTMLPYDAPCALAVGTEVRVTRDFDFGEGLTLMLGEEGVIVFAGLYAKGRAWAELLLYKIHPGLRNHDNKIILEPFVTEDILNHLKVL